MLISLHAEASVDIELLAFGGGESFHGREW
jgi:hypothetical protein